MAIQHDFLYPKIINFGEIFEFRPNLKKKFVKTQEHTVEHDLRVVSTNKKRERKIFVTSLRIESHNFSRNETCSEFEEFRRSFQSRIKQSIIDFETTVRHQWKNSLSIKTAQKPTQKSFHSIHDDCIFYMCTIVVFQAEWRPLRTSNIYTSQWVVAWLKLTEKLFRKKNSL